MIVAGSYPAAFVANDISPLNFLLDITNKLLPEEIPLHLLPFYPSSGDSGFAPSDWYTVDVTYGSWENIHRLAKKRRVIVDGIYNHVGKDHPIARKFLLEPSKYKDYLYAFKGTTRSISPRSPRGGSVFQENIIQGESWQIWQTFSTAAFDINLDNENVQEYVNKQLDILNALGIWGIRLDGPAYFGKDLEGTSPRHTPDSYRLSRMIAAKILLRGMSACAQLDCDEYGVKYFPRNLGYEIPIVDYSYSVLLLYSFLSGNVQELVSHIRHTWNIPLLRAPRTHDGILLRSANLRNSVKIYLITTFSNFHIQPRIIDNSPYEFNNSLPYLFALGGASALQIWHKIELSIAFTSILPGWSYIYLPLLFSYQPEKDYSFGNDDPRLLNRKPIPEFFWNPIIANRSTQVFSFLKRLVDIDKSIDPLEFYTDSSISIPQKSLIVVKRNNGQLIFAGNFDPLHAIRVNDFIKGHWFDGERSNQEVVFPLGFGYWRC